MNMPTQQQQSLLDLLNKSIDEGAPLFNKGKKKECFDLYLSAANLALQADDIQHTSSILDLLNPAVQTATTLQQKEEWAEGAWVLRHCFDEIRQQENVKKLTVATVDSVDDMTIATTVASKNNSPLPQQGQEEMESLEQLLKRTIRKGAPMYNEGNIQGCFDLYLETAELAVQQESLHRTAVGQLLTQAVDEATDLSKQEEYAEGAWVLRRAFDDVLSNDATSHARAAVLLPRVAVGTTATIQSSPLTNDDDGTESVVSSVSTDYYWQDAMVRNTTDLEKGQCLADTAYILRASITPTSHTRFTKSFDDCFPASQAVEVLTSLGLSGNRKMASQKCNLMWKASLLVSVSHENEKEFKDGTRLYRFSGRGEIQAKYDEVVASEPVEGSEEAVISIALQVMLEFPTLGDDGEGGTADEPQIFGGVSTAHLRPRRHSLMSKEQTAGEELALLASEYEKVIECKDRKYNFKTYENCFVGSDAVTALVNEKLADSREEATAKMEQLLQAGLIHHVARDHLFQDKTLFYRFTAVGYIKKSIDTIAAIPSTPTGGDLVRYAALVQRYKQFAGLNVTSILNSFFGCEDDSGWDLVDLENWRHNMKRWGFGRREDQDDDMVDRLAPLCVNVDPDEWDVTGDEEWESPWGILAQIAIFDQIPRSAFRGTSDAFKWDDLAIRATKVAIDKGYFETAYKSTLNQFLILLPLEHSESWEDQKLGVTLLLQLLSTVSVQDEGLSDYEIVKRLEFSKRLTTAFLEHAQVIAKFKRYPHRNRPHGRTTTLEERIWLASDLVPRWAKSQNPEDARNVIQLPVIPLKRLTRK